MAEGDSSYNVPARSLKPPSHLSSIAQGYLKVQPHPPYPSIEDKASWRALIEQVDSNILIPFQGIAGHLNCETTLHDVDGVRVYESVPAALPADDRSVILDFHGGGLVFCGGETCKFMAALQATKFQKRVWSVDYRMPPDNPYPAGLDDGVTVYRALLKERTPADIIVCGGSAGGNLAAALLLRAREASLPMPAGLILGTPEVDLTESGDSFQTNMGVDPMLQSLMPVNLMYANGVDLKDPHLSPLFGDLTGYPPTTLYSGTRDLFLSNTVRMHRALRSAGKRFDGMKLAAMAGVTFAVCLTFAKHADADTSAYRRDSRAACY